MKIVFILTLICALIAATCIGCFVILGFYTADAGVDSLFKAMAVILLLGFSSAIIAVVTGSRHCNVDQSG